MPILMNWRIWVAGVLAVLLLGTHTSAYRAGSARTQAAWNAQLLEQQQETQRIVETALAKERAMQDSAEKLRKAKNEQINRLATDLADALSRLRDRPSRGGEGSLSATPTVGAGCTGTDLFRQDSEFLIREANRADRLLADLAQCQKQYAEARGSVK